MAFPARMFFAIALLLPGLAAAQTSYTVTASDSLNYTFAGLGPDPSLTLERGKTYVFNVNAPGHPFLIRTAPGGASYTSGVTGSASTGVGTVTFVVPMNAPNTLYYQCGIHAAMLGTMNIVDPPPPPPPPPAARVWSDFDGDGRSDIFWRNSASGENYVYPMNGTTILGTEGYVRTVADQSWQVAGIGDFNGGGRADVLWRNSSTGDNYIYFMTGTAIGLEGYIRTVADQNWQVAGVGDFDGDGKDDILWRNGLSGENYVYLMDGLSIKGEGYLRTVADLSWQVAGIGDFDGDGKAGIFWRNSSTGDNYIYEMNGVSIIAEGYVRTVADQNWQVKGVADFDGNSKADVLWRNAASGDNYVYLMNGRNIAGEGYLRAVADLNWQIAAVADYDGDGKADILWRNTSTGENYVYPMDGTAIKPTEGYLRTVADQAWRVAGAAAAAAAPLAVSIYNIKSGTVATGTLVQVQGAIVTGSKPGNGFFIQVKESDPGYDGAPYSGVFVFSTTASVQLGDRVNVVGNVQLAIGQVQIAASSAPVVTSAGELLPVPVLAAPADIATGGSQAASLEGVLVRVENVSVTEILTFNEFRVTGNLVVDDYFYFANPAFNTSFASITGILAYRINGTKLLPRSAADLVSF